MRYREDRRIALDGNGPLVAKIDACESSVGVLALNVNAIHLLAQDGDGEARVRLTAEQANELSAALDRACDRRPEPLPESPALVDIEGPDNWPAQ